VSTFRDPDSEAEDRAENAADAVDAEFEAGDLDMDLGAEVRRQRRSLRSVRAVVDEFLESRLEAAIACPREEA